MRAAMNKESKSTGLWIAFEGTDGGGKSTQLERFADYLLSMDYHILRTSEPGGPLPRYEPQNENYRRAIRSLIFNDFNKDYPKIQLLLFVADRKRHIHKTVLPALTRGEIVLSDRSEGSTFAYQHYEYGVPWETVIGINDFGTEGLKPHLTILFDVDPAVGTRRTNTAQKSDTNFFDSADVEALKRRRAGYLDMAERYQELGLNRWVIIDANQDEQNVFQQLVNVTKPFLPKKT